MALDAGADLVIGSHPHVLQGIEYYKGKPIIYSLGNFMFYNSIKQTALLKASFLEEDGIQIQLLPCKADNSYTSMIQDEDEKSEFYKYITDISYQISFNKDGMIND
jgi:poly-gamma-glutamate synthesis protein (capsule biosynthesis protein)